MSQIFLDNNKANLAAQSRLNQLKNRRKLWLEVHLWLGLGLGFFLAVIGLTGSVLVFWQEIDQALNPTLHYCSHVSAQRKTLDEIVATAENAAPPGYQSAWTTIPQQRDENYVFGFYYPDGSPSPEQAQSFNIAVDPYTAQVAEKRVFYHAWNPLKHSFVGFFLKLHYAFFLGETGGIIVGWLAVLFIVSVLSGLILWWPLTGNWKRVLTIKKRASVERFNHDLHQTVGFYPLIVLLAVLVSGVYFNLPDQFRWLVERFSALTPEMPTASAIPTLSSSQSQSLEASFQQAQKLYAGGTAQYYDLNGGKQGTVRACFRDVPSLQRYVLDTGCALISRADGKLLTLIDPAHGSSGDVFMQWQWPLHSGQAFGWTGRILVFLSGLACPILFITGVIRWLQKRKAKRLKLSQQ